MIFSWMICDVKCHNLSILFYSTKLTHKVRISRLFFTTMTNSTIHLTIHITFRMTKEIHNLFSDLLYEAKSPCILKDFLGDWQPCTWSINQFSSFAADQSITVKVGAPYDSPNSVENRVPLESDCTFETWELGKYFQYIEKYSDPKKFYYAGYAHIIELVKTKFPKFDWQWAGLPQFDSGRTTLWAGTTGSFTPCHKDSYGCNIHVQLVGRKEWLLWPPYADLGATRVPYEESSTFSSVDVLQKHYTDQAIRVVLEPGQAIFLPKHWWHLANNLETSISMNCWIDLETDNLDRVQESITRLLVCSLKEKEPQTEWINPGESLSSFKENVKLLQQSLPLCKHSSRKTYTFPDSYSIIHLVSESPDKDKVVDIVSIPYSCKLNNTVVVNRSVSVVDSLLNAILGDNDILNKVTHNLCQSFQNSMKGSKQ